MPTPMPTRMSIVRNSLLAMVFPAMATYCLAQPAKDDVFPQSQLRLIVPAAPGGNPDVLARLLAQKLSLSLGKPVVVENQGGAGGTLAAGLVARSADAHTLGVLDSGAFTIAPAVAAAQGNKLPYEAARDFSLITALAAVPTLLVAHPSVPANSLTEFVAYGKANPGKINFGSAGSGGIHHLTMLAFVAQAGIEVVHVPYRGGALITAGLLAGDIHAAFNGIPNVLDHIAAGKMKVFAASTLTRLKTHPNVPTVAELGYPGFDIASTMGLVARAGVPRPIVERLQAAAAKAMREPDLVQRIEAIGMVIKEDGTANFERSIRDDATLFNRIVKSSGIKPE